MSLAPYIPIAKPAPRPKKPRRGLLRFVRISQRSKKALARMKAWNKDRQKPIRKVSAKQRAFNKETALVRCEKVAYNGPWCQIMIPGVCTRHEEGIHHRIKKSQGGDNSHGNTLLACNACNGWIEDHPALARKAGLSQVEGRRKSA